MINILILTSYIPTRDVYIVDMRVQLRALQNYATLDKDTHTCIVIEKLHRILFMF